MLFQQSFCTLCEPKPLLIHMAGALFEKYSTAINFHYINSIDSIVQQLPSPITFEYRESLYHTDEEEYLKRPYHIEQYPNKIGHLGEYYKFSRDLPKCRDGNLLRTIEKYHQNLRQLDFKKVKAAVKREQGISLTSYHDQSSFPDSNCEIKSRYSSVLHELGDENDETHLLNDICQEIQEAMPERNQVSAFKGYFPQGTKKFQDFMEKENKKLKAFCFNKKKKHQRDNQKIANKENAIKNGVNLIRNRSKKSISKNCSQKTRANDTISRQQKFKKGDKFFLKTIDYEPSFKPSPSGTILMKQQPKSTFEIYKGNINNSKYNSTKERKVSINKKVGPKNHSAKSSIFDKNCVQNAQKPNFVLDTDRQPRQQPRKSLQKGSNRKSFERNRRQESLQSSKALPLVKKSQEKRQKTLSRSKSKGKISRNASRETLKSRQSIGCSTSNLKDPKAKKRMEQVQDKEDRIRIDRLLSKKLALFMQ